jgi:hypothetical protein
VGKIPAIAVNAYALLIVTQGDRCMETKTEATIEDLYRAPNDWGTYELVDGQLVHMTPTGFGPGRVSGEICYALKLYERQTGTGYAVADNVGFIVNLPRRRSFSPDAALLERRRRTRNASLTARRCSPLRFARRAIMARPPMRHTRRNVWITSRRGRASSGM